MPILPKTKWDGSEEPTINNFYEVDRNATW